MDRPGEVSNRARAGQASHREYAHIDATNTEQALETTPDQLSAFATRKRKVKGFDSPLLTHYIEMCLRSSLRLIELMVTVLGTGTHSALLDGSRKAAITERGLRLWRTGKGHSVVHEADS